MDYEIYLENLQLFTSDPMWSKGSLLVKERANYYTQYQQLIGEHNIDRMNT